MKTQLSKLSRTRARYTEEYKQEALELWRASGRSAAKVAAELGIRPPLLYRWASLERGPNGPKAEHKPRRSVESFWSTLKYELVYHHRFATRAELAPLSSTTSKPSITGPGCTLALPTSVLLTTKQN